MQLIVDERSLEFIQSNDAVEATQGQIIKDFATIDKMPESMLLEKEFNLIHERARIMLPTYWDAAFEDAGSLNPNQRKAVLEMGERVLGSVAFAQEFFFGDVSAYVESNPIIPPVDPANPTITPADVTAVVTGLVIEEDPFEFDSSSQINIDQQAWAFLKLYPDNASAELAKINVIAYDLMMPHTTLTEKEYQDQKSTLTSVTIDLWDQYSSRGELADPVPKNEMNVISLVADMVYGADGV